MGGFTGVHMIYLATRRPWLHQVVSSQCSLDMPPMHSTMFLMNIMISSNATIIGLQSLHIPQCVLSIPHIHHEIPLLKIIHHTYDRLACTTAKVIPVITLTVPLIICRTRLTVLLYHARYWSNTSIFEELFWTFLHHWSCKCNQFLC